MSTHVKTKERILVFTAIFLTLAILFVLTLKRSDPRSHPPGGASDSAPTGSIDGAESNRPRLPVRTTKSKRISASKKLSLRAARSITALFRGLQLSQGIIETLQLSPLEVEEVETALKESFELTKKIEASLLEIGVDEGGYTTWTVPPYEEDAKAISEQRKANLVSILGVERGEFMNIAASRNTGHFFNRGKGELTIRFVDSSLNGPSLAIQLIGRCTEVEARSFENAAKQPGPLNKIKSRYGHLIGDFEEIYENLAKLKAVSTWTYPTYPEEE